MATRYSNSQLSRYRSCPLSSHYYYDLKLRPVDAAASSHHMEYSKAFHVALQHVYQGDTLASAQQVFLDNYPVQLDEADLAKTRDNGVKALAMYASRWREEDRKWKVLSCESLDAQEDGFVVKLDLVLQHRETEQVMGLDHKVTGKYLNYDYWTAFEPNSQVSEYVRFIQERYGFCDGFIINAIALRFRQRAYRGEPAGFWCAFERQTFNRNQRQLEQELESRDYWIERIEHSRAIGVWGLNTSQCKFCEYRPICQAGWTWPEDDELIKIQYRQVCSRWYGEPPEPCSLNAEHLGPHGQQLIESPMAIAVEL